MAVAAILTRRNNGFQGFVMVLFMAGIAFAQDSPMASPPLTLRSGTILTVRINEPLSSDHNLVGDLFSATLTQPVIAQGIVVARYGQTVAGQVVEAKRAGRVSGVSRLALTLTNMTLVDGQSVPIRSQMLVRQGPTSEGRDAAGVAGATGIGASIGAAADWGAGAAIGAGAGAAAGVIGVLLTRGYPTVIGPETLLTFQVTAPVTIETKYAPQAFRFVDAADYPPAQTASQEAPAYPAPLIYPQPYYVYYAPPYYPYYPYYGYPYYGYPYFGGPSFSFFFAYPGYYRYGGYYGYRSYPAPFPFRGGTMAHTFHGGAHR
jgi:hypothetical protein